jgi:phosphatidylethanolamine/phosphatidyl-N-methylethanolamine N-methyltransferase
MPLAEEAQPHESKLYYEFAHFYDRIFARVFYPRIAAVVQSLRIPAGAKVLEVGVGTGLSLDVYPHHCSVTGVDLARDMLEIAQEKVDLYGWRHIKLLEMDALNMTFADDSFDYVMAFHVVSVVPDAKRMMGELSRVCRAGGTIVVINHFRSRNLIAAAADNALAPVTRHLAPHRHQTLA